MPGIIIIIVIIIIDVIYVAKFEYMQQMRHVDSYIAFGWSPQTDLGLNASS